jgi:hypothetical protein
MPVRVRDRKPDGLAVRVALADHVGYVPVPDADDQLAVADRVDELIVDPVAVVVLRDVERDRDCYGYRV